MPDQRFAAHSGIVPSIFMHPSSEPKPQAWPHTVVFTNVVRIYFYETVLSRLWPAVILNPGVVALGRAQR